MSQRGGLFEVFFLIFHLPTPLLKSSKSKLACIVLDSVRVSSRGFSTPVWSPLHELKSKPSAG